MLVDKSIMIEHMQKKDDVDQEQVIVNVIGRGCFGVVFKATSDQVAGQVAIKRVEDAQNYIQREVDILSKFKHPNLLQLIHAFKSKDDTDPDKLMINVVTDYLPDNIYNCQNRYFNKGLNFPMHLIKIQVWQIMRGLGYMHALKIAHRDIKPENILVCGKTNQIKICDFGSAKQIADGDVGISQICSRWQRAPELIMGATQYSSAVDMWSVACVVAEMQLGQPIFEGVNQADQLCLIEKIIGSPTAEELIAMKVDFKSKPIQVFKNIDGSWNSIIGKKNIVSNLFDLLKKLFVYNPEERLTPLKCLMHPFFDDVYKYQNSDDGIASQIKNDLFKFTSEEIDFDEESVNQINYKLLNEALSINK